MIKDYDFSSLISNITIKEKQNGFEMTFVYIYQKDENINVGRWLVHDFVLVSDDSDAED